MLPFPHQQTDFSFWRNFSVDQPTVQCLVKFDLVKKRNTGCETKQNKCSKWALASGLPCCCCHHQVLQGHLLFLQPPHVPRRIEAATKVMEKSLDEPQEFTCTGLPAANSWVCSSGKINSRQSQLDRGQFQLCSEKWWIRKQPWGSSPSIPGCPALQSLPTIIGAAKPSTPHVWPQLSSASLPQEPRDASLPWLNLEKALSWGSAQDEMQTFCWCFPKLQKSFLHQSLLLRLKAEMGWRNDFWMFLFTLGCLRKPQLQF